MKLYQGDGAHPSARLRMTCRGAQGDIIKSPFEGGRGMLRRVGNQTHKGVTQRTMIAVLTTANK
jgi:hypothetical protein